jgi:N-acetylglucosaminyl-diphospho-decaprenol L-rhamnosyltransferase
MVPTGPAGAPQSLRGLYRRGWREQRLNDAPSDSLGIRRFTAFLDEPSLDIIIVTYRSRDLLRECLTSIRRHPAHVPTTIYVVDNDSRDGTIDLVRHELPEVILEAADANLGFSKANNLAIRRGHARYVLVLNPDTRLQENVFDRLIALMEAHSEVGICGCRLEREDGTFDHAAKRSFPTPLGALAHFTGVGRIPAAPKRLAQYRAPEIDVGPVDAVNGAFMLIRRKALEDVGLFDEGYWMYMEDLDLCYRFAEAGWVVWYEPSVTVVHVKAGTSGKVRAPRLNYAFHYGMFRFYRKHYARTNRRVLNATVYAGIALKFLASTLRNEVRTTFSQR